MRHRRILQRSFPSRLSALRAAGRKFSPSAEQATTIGLSLSLSFVVARPFTTLGKIHTLPVCCFICRNISLMKEFHGRHHFTFPTFPQPGECFLHPGEDFLLCPLDGAINNFFSVIYACESLHFNFSFLSTRTPRTTALLQFISRKGEAPFLHTDRIASLTCFS